MSENAFQNLEESLRKHLPEAELKEIKRILYGRSDDHELKLNPKTLQIGEQNNFEVRGYSFDAKPEEIRKPRIVRVAAVQHSIVKATSEKIAVQRDAIVQKVTKMIEAAAASGVNVICLAEAWPMPFAFCTHRKQPWSEFAEDAETGPTTVHLQALAKLHNMVIISPILERDSAHGDTIWNTAVVISSAGKYLGKHRKNHIARVGDMNESTYYLEGNTGWPVFDTEFGKIGINICFGRHHPQNWMMFGLNGAEIVFNPSATIGQAIEPLWGIEARNAAITNSYFTVANNRVGTERFEFALADAKPAHKDFQPYFGSSYVAAPNGARTPGLSRDRDGLLIVEMDLNMCGQVNDFWGFRMTQRLADYGHAFSRAAEQDFKPQLI